MAGIGIEVDPPFRLQLLNRPKSGSGQATMTGHHDYHKTATMTVPQEPNKHHVQSHEGAPRSKRQHRSGKRKSDKN